MTKVTLANVGSLIDATTAQTTINNNSAAIVTAVENTLSRDGASPNQMGAALDMNANRIFNLPSPISTQEPVRLIDLNTVIGGGPITFNSIPTGGTTGQLLQKNSNTNYDASWAGIGDYLESQVPLASAVSLSTSVTFDITNINLTPGDWDVSALVLFTGGTTTVVSNLQAGISLLSGTLDFTNGRGSSVRASGTIYNDIPAASAYGVAIPPVRFVVAVPTTIFMVAHSIFTTSTSKAYGALRARRMR